MDLRTTPGDALRLEGGTTTVPGPPNDRELALLTRILANVEVPGVEHLRNQLRMLQVAPGSDPGCRIYLLHPETPRASFATDGRHRLPGGFTVRTPQGRVIGELVVWIDHGHLRALQFVRHDARPALLLPDPSWIELPASAVDASVRGHGARHALIGVRTIGEQPLLRAPASAAASESTTFPWWRVATAVFAVVVLGLAALAFATARAGGADLEAARAAGAAEGAELGTAHGELAGSFAGRIEGELAGRASTFQTAHDSARARVLVAARRRVLEQRRAAQAAAAAAAAAPSYPNPSTCIGYRASNGAWVCS